MLNTYMAFAGRAFDSIYEIQERQEERKVEILKEFEESKKLPRKLKKKVRKELQLDWDFANYNIFEEII